MRDYKIIAKRDIERKLQENGYTMETKVMAWALTIGEKYYNCTLEEAIDNGLHYGVKPILVRYKENNTLGFITIGKNQDIRQIEFLKLKNPNSNISKYIFEEYKPLV